MASSISPFSTRLMRSSTCGLIDMAITPWVKVNRLVADRLGASTIVIRASIHAATDTSGSVRCLTGFHGSGGRRPNGGGSRSTSLEIRPAYCVQQGDEALDLEAAERCHSLFVCGVHERVERVEQLPTSVGDEAEDLPAIRHAPLSPDEGRLLELVEQSRDRGALLDHALADRQRRNPAGSCAADDAERVVLSQTQAIRLHDSGQRAAHDRRGAEQGDRRLLRGRLERLGLPDLAQDSAGPAATRMLVAGHGWGR